MPSEVAEELKAKQSGYMSLSDLPVLYTDLPENITPSTYMYSDEDEMSGPAVGYSHSRFALGLMLRSGPSKDFSFASPYPVLYNAPVEVYSHFIGCGMSAKVIPGVGSANGWYYVCYNGIWGWCEDTELVSMPAETPDVTMPAMYYIYEYGYSDTNKIGHFFTKSDTTEVRKAPSDDSDSVTVLPGRTAIELLGTTIPASSWQFISYGTNSMGWIDIGDGDLSETLYTSEEYYDAFPIYPDDPSFVPTYKPAIYLYPVKETDISVKLDLHGSKLMTTYPRYNGGWQVTAYPDGHIVNKADGGNYDYLFWDAVSEKQIFDLSKGFCVKGEDTERFLREKLTYLGLNEREMNEFIVFWLPMMEHNTYNLITFQTDRYTDMAELTIEPKPDTLIRVYMTTEALEAPVDIEPQELEPAERHGYTAVEWGGSVIG